MKRKEEPPKVAKAIWHLITTNGNEYILNKEEKKNNQFIKFYPTIQATDPQTGEVMVTREDNLRLIYRTDGSTLVEYQDGTRITSFYSMLDMNLSNETNNGSNGKREKYVKIECPGFATTIFNSKTTDCTLVFGNGALAQCDPKKMSYNVINSTGETLDIENNGSVSLLPRNSNEYTKNKFLFNQNGDIVLEHQDEEGNRFKVNKIGRNYISTVNGNLNQKNHMKSYKRHSPRLFFIK
jgi:hypothetical protein